MNTHVFVVDSDSYPVHRDRLFCGVKNPNMQTHRKTGSVGLNTAFFSLYADLKALRKGDLVFFYQMRTDEAKLDRGFRGIFRVTSDPFFDQTEIKGVSTSTGDLGSANKAILGKCPHCNSSLSEIVDDDENLKCKNCGRKLPFHILPNRVLIEPVKCFKRRDNTEAVIDDNTAYIDRNYIKENLPILWTMLFRKTYGAGRERSITHVLPEEADKLRYIFEDLKKQKIFQETTFAYLNPYKPTSAKPLEIPLENEDGELKIEALLEAWFMENIDKKIPVLKDIIGDPSELEYFGNNVLYGIGGERVDILCLHKKNGQRFRATVIELKKGDIKKDDIEQIHDYTKWMAQLVFGEDTKEAKSKIQPVLIGFTVSEKNKEYAKSIITETQKPILLEYTVKNKGIEFKRVL